MSKVAVTSRNYNEKAYLASNPDVAESVKKGDFKSGKAHYKTFGWKENRMMENGEPESVPLDSVPVLFKKLQIHQPKDRKPKLLNHIGLPLRKVWRSARYFRRL